MKTRLTSFHTKPRKPMARSGFARKTPSQTSQNRSGRTKTIKPKRSARAKKMALKRAILDQYDLPQILCSRWGTAKNPTRSDILRGMLWTVFSKYIRKRDQGRCISCGAFKSFEELQAGHYVPVGGNDLELCFDERNVNAECESCNAFDSFHLVPMRKNLVVKYGEEAVMELDTLAGQKRAIKWGEEIYVNRIRYYLMKNI